MRLLLLMLQSFSHLFCSRETLHELCTTKEIFKNIKGRFKHFFLLFVSIFYPNLSLFQRYPSEDYEPVQLLEGVPPSPFFNEDPDLNSYEDFHFVRRSAEPRNNVDKR